jgi:2-dehydropantoate 2-reductase
MSAMLNVRIFRRHTGGLPPNVIRRATRHFMHQHASDDTIYVLGVGNLGKYVAHSLMKQTSKPVTLLFHRPSLEVKWRAQGGCIQCITDGATDTTSRFGVEVLSPPSASSVTPRLEPPIKYLIVATKTYMTAGALELVKNRLSATSSVLFLQNGMGMWHQTREPSARYPSVVN